MLIITVFPVFRLVSSVTDVNLFRSSQKCIIIRTKFQNLPPPCGEGTPLPTSHSSQCLWHLTFDALGISTCPPPPVRNPRYIYSPGCIVYWMKLLHSWAIFAAALWLVGLDLYLDVISVFFSSFSSTGCFELCCYHQWKWLPGNTQLWSDLLCVECHLSLMVGSFVQ